MMKKIFSLLLAMVSCCVFAVSASADGAADPAVPEQTTSASEVTAPAETTTTEGTETTQTTAPTTSAAQGFTGTVRITYDDIPVNTELPVTITVEGSELSDGDTIRYRLYDSTVSDADVQPGVYWQDYTGSLKIAGNTVIEAAVFFSDGSRSESAVCDITCIDTIPPMPPQIQLSTTEWTKDPVNVSISGGSDEQSGLLRMEYRIGAEGAWTEYTDVISISTRSTVYARSLDVAGNASQNVLLEVNNFDFTPPDSTGLTISLSSSGTPVVADNGAFSRYFSSQVTAVLDGASDTDSGVVGYEYQLVSGSELISVNKWQKYDPATPLVISGDFCGYVCARAVDGVGNYSSAVASDGFVIDVTRPVIDNITLSETKLTGNRVVVTFTVEDNYWLETVMVNGVYAGIYSPTFTAFRNDDYVIVAYDKVGNRSETVVSITNINTTPFTLLDTWNSMNPQDFTPSTWSVAEKAANELQTLITVDSGQAQIESAAGRLLTALEGLVTRGDGTLSRELIKRVEEFDASAYTESSWANLQQGLAELKALLDDPESTQETVDSGRRALEQRVAELEKLASFADLDRLIAQCEGLDTDGFSDETYDVFIEALNSAKELSRTDSGQDDADLAYTTLLAAMGGLEVEEKLDFNFAPIVFVVLGLLIVATATALFIVRMRARDMLAAQDEDEYGEDGDDSAGGYGDIQFVDDSDDDGDLTYDDDADFPDDGDGYIGRRK